MDQEQNKYTVFDVETTGLYTQRGARIIEIGAVQVANGTLGAEFGSLIDCDCPIPEGVGTIHGITSEMLVGQPTMKEVLSRFCAFIGDSILVAHNAKFDVKFLRHELGRLGQGLKNRYVCTLKLSQRQFPGLTNYKLETVAKHVLGELPDGLQRHRALDDARLTAMVFVKMG